MNKSLATLPTSNMVHTKDTVITLPKSNKQFIVPKGLSANKIALLDEYLSTHTISNKTASVMPYAGYYQHTESYWEQENQYQPINGRTLGIWQTWTSPSQLYPLGFREITIYNTTDRDTAYNDGFQYSNMMFMNDGNNVSYNETRYSNLYDPNKPVTRCYIDEPYESSNQNPWSPSDIATYINFLQNYPSTTLTVSSWHSPNTEYENLVSIPMVYIMDDYYTGDVTSSWTTFKNGYGSKNTADWISLERQADGTGYSDYSSCFGAANRLGISDVWLYAYDYGNLSTLQNYSYAAWANAWLSRLEKHLVIVYQCSGLGCSWPDGGTWTVYTAYYDDEQWINY